jgi:23S rRNA (uridine2552-2'-O)-methyltransferase
VQQSKREGYRSRSAYKLTEIDERDKLLKGGLVVVDLGPRPAAGPRSRRSGGPLGRVIAIDLLQMEPITGVTFLQGDFTSRSGLADLERPSASAPVDLVLSDMAPNMSGIPSSDQARSMELAELARDFALSHLQPEGAFLVKIFQGAGYDEYLRSLRRRSRRWWSASPRRRAARAPSNFCSRAVSRA